MARNTLWLSASRIGTKLLSLPLVIILARVLGPEGFGRWALITSLVAILSTVADGGFQTVTIRDLAARPGRSRSYYRKTLTARLVLSLASAAGLLVWGLTVEADSAPLWVFALGGLLLFPEAFLRGGQAVLNARERMDLASAVSLAQAAGGLLVVGGLVLAGGGLVGGLIGLAVVNIASAGAMSRLAGPYLQPGETESASPWRLFTTAFPYGLLGLLVILYFRVDVVMLAAMKGDDAAGIYNAAVRLFEAGLVVPAALTGALFPVMARQMADARRDLLADTARRAVRLLTHLSVPLGLAGIFFGPTVIEILFGRGYLPAGAVLGVFSAAFFLFFINAPLGNLMAASDMMARFVPWAAANTGLNVVLNLALIPGHGALGAAWATFITEASALAITVVFARRILGQATRLPAITWRPLTAGLPTACLWLLWSPEAGLWPLNLAAGLALYAGAAWLLRGLEPSDREMLARVTGGWLDRIRRR